jgi:6-phosphogluconolactonase
MRPDVHVGEGEDLALRLASLFARQAQSRVPCAVALTGGSVATTCYPEMSRTRCDWSRIAFFWGDERAVPPDHPDSNYGLARKLWLDPAGVPAASIHRMEAERPDIEAAARAYEETLLRVAGDPPRLDLVLLGVGPDGHVCSLFPGHALLRAHQRYVAAVEDSPKPPPRRLTLTLPVLRAAEMLAVVAMGEAKAAVMREALEDETSPLPVALALRGARHAVVLLDPAAAGSLPA